MKKISVIVTALFLVAAPAANAQAFLNKIKEKAEKAISNAVSDKVSEKVNEKVTDKVTGKISEKTGIDISAMDSDYDSDSPAAVAPDQQLQRRRTSTFAWNEEVTPSTAKFPIPLMNEFPKVPSAAELANPTEANMVAYYRAIKRVTLRAEELNEDETCGDEFAAQWREKVANEMAASFGMSRAEIDRLFDDNTPEAEKEALGQKMVNAMTGGINLDNMAAMGNGPMPSEQSLEDAAFNAAMKVYQENPAETKYVTGKTPAELNTLMRTKKPEQYEPELNAYTNSMLAKEGDAYRKRMEAFQKKVADASTAALSSAAGLGDIMALTKNAGNMTNAMNSVMKQQQAMQKLSKAMTEMSKSVSVPVVDAEFSAAEAKKIETIKKQIYATDDPKVYNPLYLQAIDAIKSYRLRAAGVWSAALQKQVDEVKAKVPAFIKTFREEIEQGVLPECALYRAPLNVVIETGDLLEEAYSEFPANYPPLYDADVIVTASGLFWPEFAVSDKIDEMINKYLFKEVNGKICRYDGGKWTPAPEIDYDKLPKLQGPKSGSWKSSDGKREVIYNADGGWLQLPEGDVVYPYALEVKGNVIQWISMDSEYDSKTGESVDKVSKCTYKL